MQSKKSKQPGLINESYKYGFTTNIESDTIAAGLSEEVVRLISSKKKEPKWLLDWRLKAYVHFKKLQKKNKEEHISELSLHLGNVRTEIKMPSSKQFLQLQMMKPLFPLE